MSKFSPTEFLESINYYTGYNSPIDNCKAKNGYSLAWIHHKNHNDHHYEHWTDNYDTGTIALDMPLKPSIEMICDYLGAGKAYNGKNFTYKGEFQWLINKFSKPCKMNVHQKYFCYKVMYYLYRIESTNENIREILNYTELKRLYNSTKKITDKEFESILKNTKID